MNPRVIFFVTAILLSGCNSNGTLLQERAAQWQARLNASVPLGSTAKAAKDWGKANGVTFAYLEQQRQLHALAERIPETGLNKLVCSEWSILIKVSFATNGLSEKNEVSTAGTCL